jgi:RYK receptor-like tyrosine kinase
VKLADNSLSRDLFPGDYYCLGDSENRPIKWLALEALQRKHFSEASDTWAFGVLMWELCTLARQPYAEVSWDCMEEMLNSKVYICLFASFFRLILSKWNITFKMAID